MEDIVTFRRIFPAAIPPMRADESALGTLPAAAYQFCEAVRAASSFGWYVFPPCDIRLRWGGAETQHFVDGEWHPLGSEHLGEDFLALWDAHVPEDLRGRAPPYLSNLFVPGIVQIWSGHLVGTAPGWSVLVRPPANMFINRSFACFEGLVETDRFGPCPLFVNIRLLATDREIVIPRTRPLFQLQPIRRECYADATLKDVSFASRESGDGNPFGMSDADWAGFRKTIRNADPADSSHRAGSYGAGVRRRAKRELTNATSSGRQ
jgi:hypothetical protein